MQAKAEIITIGDEILYGQTLDTNSHWISGELDAIGVTVVRKTTIPDDENEILNAFSDAHDRADIVLITGGLGPTSDDFTKPCLSKYFGVRLELNEEALRDIKDLFAARGRELTQLNRDQAQLPEGALKITNRLGTAPGIWLEDDKAIFVSMPGVPHEMKGMMTHEILPKLQEKFNSEIIHHRIIRTGGIPESRLAEKLADWEKQLPHHIRLAYLPTLAQVKLRLTARGNDLETLKKDVNVEIEKCLPIIGKYVYATENIELEVRLGQMLREQNKTIACAESCTGGYLSHLITLVPGSSAYYVGSYIPYSYQMKENLLNVNHETLETKGAVSEEVVIQMAEGVRKAFNSSIGVSISGIAGPDGGTSEKPVGTVWMAVSDEKGTTAKKYTFGKDRKINIQLTALAAMNMLRYALEKSGS